MKGVNEPGYGPGDDPEPTEEGDRKAFANGMDFLAGGGARDPKNDEKTRGILGKMSDIVERGKARSARNQGKKGK